MLSELHSIDCIRSVLNKHTTKFCEGGRSISDKENILHALEGRLILKEFGRFKEKVSLEKFDWVSVKQDRNWWWQIQSLPFLNWCVGAFHALTDDEKKKALVFCHRALMQWLNVASENKKSPLVWHDHASAFRLRNIVRWVSFIAFNNLQVGSSDAESFKSLISSISDHIEFLKDEKNYSRHTNHGFDQMLAVYTVSLQWNGVKFMESVSEWSSKRLIDELDFAFTEQGVHKENSPGYQKFMLSRLRQLSDLKDYGDETVCNLAGELSGKAQNFLAIITLPSGELPMIGDTQGGDKGDYEGCESSLEIFDYSSSGYFVLKGFSTEGSPFHFVFKCTHLSNYHRHDDDLSLHLYYNGEIVLGDGGLGYYNEKDGKRIFLRSAASHNTVYPVGLSAVRHHEHLSSPSVMYREDEWCVSAESSSYGGRVKRTINFKDIQQGVLKVFDEWLDFPASPKQVVNYYFHGDVGFCLRKNSAFTIRTKRNLVNVSFRDSNNELDSLEPIGIQVFSAVYSPRYNVFKVASRVVSSFDIMKDRKIVHKIVISDKEAVYKEREASSITFESVGVVDRKIRCKELMAHGEVDKLITFLWELTPANKEVGEDLAFVNGVLASIDDSFLKGDVLYLYLRVKAWLGDSSAATTLLDRLAKEKNISLSQILNSRRVCIPFFEKGSEEWMKNILKILDIIHEEGGGKYSELYANCANLLLKQLRLPTFSQAEFKDSLTLPCLLEYITKHCSEKSLYRVLRSLNMK